MAKTQLNHTKANLKNIAVALLKAGGFTAPDWLAGQDVTDELWAGFETNRAKGLELLSEKAQLVEIPPHLSLSNFANCVADVYATLLYLQASGTRKLLQAVIHHRVLISVNRAYVEYMSQWTLSAIGKAMSFADEMGKGLALMSNEDIFWTAVHIASETSLEDASAKAQAAIFRDYSVMGGRQLGEVSPELAVRMVHGLGNAKLPKHLSLMKVVGYYLKAAARVFGITMPQPTSAPIVTFTTSQPAYDVKPTTEPAKPGPKNDKTPPGGGLLPPGLEY